MDGEFDMQQVAREFGCGRDIEWCLSLVRALIVDEVKVSANAVYRVEHRVTRRAAILEEIEYLRLRVCGAVDTSRRN
jgi:hypothetical protein